jgi:hypothetical protein
MSTDATTSRPPPVTAQLMQNSARELPTVRIMYQYWPGFRGNFFPRKLCIPMAASFLTSGLPPPGSHSFYGAISLRLPWRPARRTLTTSGRLIQDSGIDPWCGGWAIHHIARSPGGVPVLSGLCGSPLWRMPAAASPIAQSSVPCLGATGPASSRSGMIHRYLASYGPGSWHASGALMPGRMPGMPGFACQGSMPLSLPPSALAHGRQNGQTSRARAHSGTPGRTLHTL